MYRPVPELFAAQVIRTPEAEALRCGATRLTYAELDRRVDVIQGRLIDLGIGRGHLVAVMLERSTDLVVALLAVLKAGAAYLPLSPTDPPARIDFILQDSQASAVIGTGEGVEGAPRLLRIDEPGLRRVLEAPPDHRRVAVSVGEHDAAYVIYTSGSTGRPKGVIVDHRALSAYLRYAVLAYPAVAGQVILHSSVSFDMSVTSLFAPLLAGGRVEIADLAGPARRQVVDRPTLLKITPSHLGLLEILPEQWSPTETLVIGGESLTGAALAGWRRHHPEVTIVNEYGPTEATVGCCTYFISPGDELDCGRVAIGRAIEGTSLYVLDDKLRTVPQGELYIGGYQVSRGYLGKPALTADAFLPDPFGPPGARMYRTGDIVRRTGDGDLEFLGRGDDQVKVRGHRVELGEVTAVIGAFSEVLQAAVVARDTDFGEKQLVAYLVPREGGRLNVDAIKAEVAELLPAPMVPARWLKIDALPLTPNGKLDQSVLMDIADPQADPQVEKVAPRTEPEIILCRLFTELTSEPRVGVDDDFFVLGGNSLTAAKLVGRAARQGLQIELEDVLKRRTARRIAETVSARIQ